MAAYTQDKRLIAVETPLGKDVLLLTSFSGQEEMSRLFSFELEMLSERQDIAPQEIVGKRIDFKVTREEGGHRYFNGFVSRFSAGTEEIRGLRLYRAEVVPWLWFLTRTADCRIFQNKSVPKIIENIFTDLGCTDFDTGGLKNRYRTWNYCVQYRETDFNFVSRLMEQEGIFYWFRHEKSKHILVLADNKAAHKFCDEKEVEYNAGAPASAHIAAWEHQYEYPPGKWTHTDYNFETPGINMKSSSPTLVSLPGVPEGMSHKENCEIYDYPGEYANKADGETLSRLRMEEEESSYHRVNASSACRTFSAGGKFTLKRHPFSSEEGKTYLLTSVQHNASDDSYISDAAAASKEYSNNFTCMPAEVVFRPDRITPKPLVQGPQTAVVVGPAGEEIYPDKYGRVKVQFHWDREGKRDENSSCWVRVSQQWAGKQWGAIQIPRLGQEVIVEFLEGDPDQPIITGRVYNAELMPPYSLPANKTQSGTKSRSSKGGSGENFNEIRFEDKKGEEQVYIHAEKNQDNVVENDETTSVGHDRSEDIGNDETITIGRDRTEKVGRNESITIGENRTEKVGKNETIGIGDNRKEDVGNNENITIGANRTEQVGDNETITIGANRTEKVGKDETITIGSNRKEQVGKDENLSVGDNRSHQIGKNDTLNVGKKLDITAGDQIVLKTGKASITMKKDGTILIKGKDITIQGSGGINVKASKNVVIKGKKILEN